MEKKKEIHTAATLTIFKPQLPQTSQNQKTQLPHRCNFNIINNNITISLSRTKNHHQPTNITETKTITVTPKITTSEKRHKQHHHRNSNPSINRTSPSTQKSEPTTKETETKTKKTKRNRRDETEAKKRNFPSDIQTPIWTLGEPF
jgi:hypothetical protein